MKDAMQNPVPETAAVLVLGFINVSWIVCGTFIFWVVLKAVGCNVGLSDCKCPPAMHEQHLPAEAPK